MLRSLLVLAVLAVVGGFAATAPALGASPAERAAAQRVVRHCTAGRSLAHDRTAALVLARKTLPSDVREYTDCADRIAVALQARHYVRPLGPNRVAAVRADCADRVLDRRYRRATLVRTRRALPVGSACRELVARELRR